MQKTAILIFISLFLTACSEDNLSSFKGGEVSLKDFEYYLQAKGIQDRQSKNLIPILSNYTRKEALTSILLEGGLIDDELIELQVKDYKHQLVLNKYFESFISEKVTPEAVKNYYAANSSDYESKKAHLAHILLRIRKGMSNEEVESLRTKAYSLHGQLVAGGEFMQLAKIHSNDNLSAPKGGDLGWIKEGSIDPVFSKVGFALKKGEISDPVRSVYGFHIIKSLDAPKIVKTPFEDVKGEIHHSLRSKAKQAEIARLLDEANIEINQERLANVN